MSLGDVVVEKTVDNHEARRAISELWGIPLDDVVIVNDLEELASVPETYQVMCHKWALNAGQFRTVMSFHEGRFSGRDRLEAAKRLSELLQSRCLLSDESEDPFSMIAVHGKGPTFIVNLDPDHLDNDEYVIR